MGFLVSQDTGLKKKKYAYFYCQKAKINTFKNKKEEKGKTSF